MIRQLPLPARMYVGSVIAAGVVVMSYCLTRVEVVAQWKLFLSLVVLSCVASTLRIRLPLARGSSTMSISYVVDFTSLLLLGPEPTVFVAAASAVTQSIVNAPKESRPYRTLFNIAAIVITIEAAGWVLRFTGGNTAETVPKLIGPLMATATIYYLVNTMAVAIAVALSSGRRSLMKVWNDDFLWCAPSYFVGAIIAQISAATVFGANQWLLPALIPPVYLTFRSYKMYLGRLEEEQRRAQEVTALHDRAQRALSSARQSEGRLRETLDLLKHSEERYALAAAGSNDGLWDWDVTRNRIYFSDRCKTMLGLSSAVPSTTLNDWLSRVHPDDVEALRTALNAHLSGATPHLQHEHRVWAANGAYRWILCRGIAVRDADGTATRVAGSQTDVTVRHEVQARLEHAARHDSLTDLPNRATFMHALERVIDRSRQTGVSRYAVFFIDVDRFKLVNDSLGHIVGDQLLTSVARTLASCLRSGDILARLGGDEFAILFDGVNGVGDVALVAERIQWLFREPLRLDAVGEVFVSTSIGIAMGSPEYGHSEELLRDADTAMYEAKASGKACHAIFEPRMRDQAMSHLRLDTEMRRAIEHNELQLFYQPVIALDTGRLSGFEALLRWHKANGEIVPPSAFIPLAEETGVIVPVGDWALNEACRQAAEWQRDFHFPQPLTMSVNISPRQLMQPGIVESIKRRLHTHGLLNGSLGLEITESALAEDTNTAMRVIEELKRLPVQLLLDDFGTGYSSLGHLHRFPVDTVKIDRSFLNMEASSPSGGNVLAAIVSLARNLGKGIIVEGIETSEHVERVRRLRCPFAQGFYFSKPLDAREATALVAVASVNAAGALQADQAVPIETLASLVH